MGLMRVMCMAVSSNQGEAQELPGTSTQLCSWQDIEIVLRNGGAGSDSCDELKK